MVDVFARIHNGSVFQSTGFIQRATLQRTEGQHDLFTMYMSQKDPTAFEDLTGSPVEIDLRAGNCRCMFHGYLDLAAPARRSGVIDSQVNVFGATSPLRNGHSRSWTKRTPAAIALDVLAPYRLGLEIDAFPGTIDFISQVEGESDWQLLTRLAQKIGFSLSSEDVVIRMVDARSQEDRTPSMSYETLLIPANTRSVQTNVTLFEVETTGSPDKAQYKDMVVSGRNRWGVPFSYRPSFDPANAATIEPEFTQAYHGTVTSLSGAMLEVARVNRQARWTNKAHLVCTEYRENLKPGMCALIVDVDGRYGGFWYVTDSTGTFDCLNGTSMMEATLVRDSTNPVRRSAPARMQAARYPMARLTPDGWETDRHWELIS